MNKREITHIVEQVLDVLEATEKTNDSKMLELARDIYYEYKDDTGYTASMDKKVTVDKDGVRHFAIRFNVGINDSNEIVRGYAKMLNDVVKKHLPKIYRSENFDIITAKAWLVEVYF